MSSNFLSGESDPTAASGDFAKENSLGVGWADLMETFYGGGSIDGGGQEVDWLRT